MAAISGRSGARVTPGTGGVGIEQRGELAPARRRPREFVGRVRVPAVRPARQRDARPFHPQRPGIGLAVAGIVQGGEDVVEQVFRAEAEAVEIALCGAGEVGAVRRVFAISDTAFEKPHWNIGGAPVHVIDVTNMCGYWWERPFPTLFLCSRFGRYVPTSAAPENHYLSRPRTSIAALFARLQSSAVSRYGRIRSKRTCTRQFSSSVWFRRGCR